MISTRTTTDPARLLFYTPPQDMHRLMFSLTIILIIDLLLIVYSFFLFITQLSKAETEACQTEGTPCTPCAAFMAKMRPTLLLFMLGLAASQVVLSAATMKNKKRYRRISKAGFVCKAGGKLAYLESPTLDQCYIYCSVHDDVQDPPFFFGYTRGDQGIPECVCYGSGCVLTSKTKSLSTSVAGTNSLSTSSVEEGIKSGWGAGKRRWLQDSSFGIYRGK